MQELTTLEKKAINRNKLKFVEMAKTINSYLKEEGLCLNFKGYTDTIIQYLSISDINLEGLSNLCYDLNLWSNYLGEVEGFILYKMLKIENKLLYHEGLYDKYETNIPLEKIINENKRNYYHFKLFLKHVINQKKMFEKAYKHCLSTYDKALNNFIYKYNY